MVCKVFEINPLPFLCYFSCMPCPIVRKKLCTVFVISTLLILRGEFLLSLSVWFFGEAGAGPLSLWPFIVLRRLRVKLERVGICIILFVVVAKDAGDIIATPCNSAMRFLLFLRFSR